MPKNCYYFWHFSVVPTHFSSVNMSFSFKVFFQTILCCWWSSASNEKVFVIFLGIIIVPECQNCNNIAKCLYSNSYFSKATLLIASEKVAIELLKLSEWYWLEILSIPFPHWNPDWPEIPELFVRRDHFDFGTPVSPNQLAWFVPPKSQSKAFYLCWKMFLKVIGFFSVKWNPDGTEVPECAVNLDMPRYSNSYFFSSTCFVFPSSCQSKHFYLRPTIRFKISWWTSSTSTLESWFTKVSKKLFVLNYRDIATRLLESYWFQLLIST